jgi:cytochrome bd ubiquinol oxidase subunit II
MCAAYVLGYVGLFLAIVSISMPVMNPDIRALWFSDAQLLFPRCPIPLASLVLILLIWRDLYRGRESARF